MDSDTWNDLHLQIRKWGKAHEAIILHVLENMKTKTAYNGKKTEREQAGDEDIQLCEK